MHTLAQTRYANSRGVGVPHAAANWTTGGCKHLMLYTYIDKFWIVCHNLQMFWIDPCVRDYSFTVRTLCYCTVFRGPAHTRSVLSQKFACGN